MPGRKRREDVERRLANAYIELAATGGAYRITLEAAAKKAEVPFSTAHYHLKAAGCSLVELGIRAVGVSAQEYITSWLAERAKRDPDSNTLHHYIEGSFEWIKTYRNHGRLLLFQYYLISGSEIEQIKFQEFIDVAKLRIEKLIYENRGRGYYQGVKKPSEMSDSIHSIMMGAVTRGLVSNIPDSLNFHMLLTIKTVDELLNII